METKTKQILQDLTSADFLCEKCGCGYKHRDKTGLRNWCKRCIDIYYRKQDLEIEFAEKMIFDIVEPGYAHAKLEDFDDVFNDDVKEKLTSLNRGDDLFVFGNPGTGKTYLFAALIRHYVYQGYECRRINFDDFCVQIRSTMSPASKLTEWDLVEPMKCVDLLVIDDLVIRSKPETDFAYVTLYSILNKRQERLLSTFVSSNKGISRLEQNFDNRITSRLQTALIIEMTGQDRRKRAKQ